MVDKSVAAGQNCNQYSNFIGKYDAVITRFNIPLSVNVFNQTDFTNKVLIYPNPSAGNYILKIKDYSDPFIKLDIYDYLGKLIKSVSFNQKQLISDRFIFNIEEFTSGIYIVKTMTKKNTYINKIVKQ